MCNFRKGPSGNVNMKGKKKVCTWLFTKRDVARARPPLGEHKWLRRGGGIPAQEKAQTK